MKILFITIDNNPKTLGGVQTFGRNLKRIYKERLLFLTNKFKIDNKYMIERDLQDIIEIYSSNKILRAINKLMKNKIRKYLIIRKIKQLSPDVCIISNDNELIYLKDIKTKVICVQHNKAEKYTEEEKNFYRKESFASHLKFRKPDYMICLCEEDRKKFENYFKDNSIKCKFLRFPNEMEISEGKKCANRSIVMITRLQNEQKRIDLAIKAMKKLPDFQLNIYGEGPNKEDYKKIIETENLKNVFLKGSTREVRKVLDTSGIFVMTSDYEGYPVSSIEAMRRGLPIVIRNTFGAAEDIVVNNKNGILLEKEWDEDKFVEAIKKVYDDYEYYSENSKKLGKRYNLEIIKREWDKIIEGK